MLHILLALGAFGTVCLYLLSAYVVLSSELPQSILIYANNNTWFRVLCRATFMLGSCLFVLTVIGLILIAIPPQ